MRWPWQSRSSDSPVSGKDSESSAFPLPVPTSSDPRKQKSVSWNNTLNATDWEHFKEPRNWIPTLLVTATALASLHVYRSYLRRIPGVDHIQPSFFRKRSLFGRVTSVGDGDNFHLFHTPGGRLAGWGWLRAIPKERKELKGRTISVRIAGIDAPEGAHFGRPAQPYAAEALSWLSGSILHRPIRAYIYRRDQYERVVATVYIRRFLFFRKDIGLEMLRRGLATTYEAKTGAEFGGAKMEKKYRAAEAEAKSKGKGLWSALGGKSKGWFGLGKGPDEPFETPREYKSRMNSQPKPEKGDQNRT